MIRSHLKKRILVLIQGGNVFQPAGILQYVEDLEQFPNTGFGPKDFFEIASINIIYRILTILIIENTEHSRVKKMIC